MVATPVRRVLSPRYRRVSFLFTRPGARPRTTLPDLDLLYLDDHLVVADKPAGLLCVPGRGPDKADCLAARVQAAVPDALVVHRLDMGTSGLVVFARGLAIQRALSGFRGVGRRFHRHGEVATADGGRALLVDDYGHHPRELAAVFAAARGGWPDKRLVVAFQPHRYTRTRDLLDDFAETLAGVDVLVLTEVYPAGEAPIANADGKALARAVRSRGRVDPVLVKSARELPHALAPLVRDGDLVLLLGAGDIGQVAPELASAARFPEVA